MEKQPLTNIGFANVQAVLYQLPDDALKAEAQSIYLHFKTWMNDHFLLCASQLQFLENLDPVMLDTLSKQTGFAVANRLAVTLAKADGIAHDDKPGKIIGSKNNFNAEAGTGANFQATGDLRIEIRYQS